MDKLKHCPFCGNEHLQITRNYQFEGLTMISCDSCEMVISFNGPQSKKTAVKKFNNRALDIAPLSQTQKELIEMAMDKIDNSVGYNVEYRSKQIDYWCKTIGGLFYLKLGGRFTAEQLQQYWEQANGK